MDHKTAVSVLEGKQAAEDKNHLTAAYLPHLPSRRMILVLINVMFAVLAISINVMQFAGGYSQIRPVNAIPLPVSLVFGPFGVLGYTFGDLLGDLIHISDY